MKKIENFRSALSNLKDVNRYEEPYDNVVLTGLVGLYEICFEQAWKAMKYVLELNGIPEAATGSPRSIIKSAFRVGLITDEQLWLDALASRNNVSHAYNQSIALDIIRRTRSSYIAMFEALDAALERNL